MADVKSALGALTLFAMSGKTRKNPPGSAAVAVGPTECDLVDLPEKHGRNELCPCGSGKKYKRCCL